jgi:hypothetical protein
LTDYARTMGDGGYHRANSKLLAFLKGAIYVQALDSNRYDPDLLADVEAEIDRVTVTEFARRLGFPIDDRLPDPLQVLANLPFEIILTTSPFTFVEDALRRAGKNPRAEFCRWRVGLQAVPSAVEDGYQPSSAKPLVYHLMGLDSFPESLVLSEDDALDYLMAVAERPEVVLPDVWKAIASSSLLLLGHSLDSLDWRTLEHAILSGRSAPESVFQLVPHQDTARSKLIDSYLRRAGLMPYWETPSSILGRIWEMYQRG